MIAQGLHLLNGLVDKRRPQDEKPRISGVPALGLAALFFSFFPHELTWNYRHDGCGKPGVISSSVRQSPYATHFRLWRPRRQLSGSLHRSPARALQACAIYSARAEPQVRTIPALLSQSRFKREISSQTRLSHASHPC